MAVQARHDLVVLRDRGALFLEVLRNLDGQLVARLDVVGHERHRDDEHVLVLLGQLLHRVVRRGRQPLRGPDFALEGRAEVVVEPAVLHQVLHRRVDETAVRVLPVFHFREGRAVRAEEKVHVVPHIVGEALQALVDSVAQRLDVLRVRGVLEDGGRGPGRNFARFLQLVPVHERGAGRGLGVLGVEGEQHDLVDAILLHLRRRVFAERLPVAHRHVRLERGARLRGVLLVEGLLQIVGLVAGEGIDGRAPVVTDLLVVLRDRLGPEVRDNLGERLSHAAPRLKINDLWEVDDRRVHEQVVEKRLHGLLAVGAAQVEEHDPYRIARLHAELGRWKKLPLHQTGVTVVLLTVVALYELVGRHWGQRSLGKGMSR